MVRATSYTMFLTFKCQSTVVILVPPAVAARIVWNWVCSSILPSIRVFSWNLIIRFFWVLDIKTNSQKLKCNGCGQSGLWALKLAVFQMKRTRHFRSKLVHWNESVYCTPIDKTLKMRFNERSRSFQWPIIPELWKFF